MMRGTTEKIKFKRLKRRLGLTTFATVGLLELLWHITAKNAPNGALGRFEDEDIAEMLDWDQDPALLIAALVEERWLDQDPEYRLIVHDWSSHADDAVHMALVRSAELFADGHVPKLTRFAENERSKLKARLSERFGADVIAAGKRDRKRGHFEPCAQDALDTREDALKSALPEPGNYQLTSSSGSLPGNYQETSGITREGAQHAESDAASLKPEAGQGGGGVLASLSSGGNGAKPAPEPSASLIEAQRRIEQRKSGTGPKHSQNVTHGGTQPQGESGS